MTSPTSVLIVDDDATLTELYRVKFEREGYQVSVCHDGQEAFDALKGGLKPDIIVLDLLMPNMDGLTFLRDASFKLRLPPVIVMTSETADVKRLEAVVRGAHAYLIKAKVTPADVLAQIKSLLSTQPH